MHRSSSAPWAAALIVFSGACKSPAPARVEPDPPRRLVASAPDASAVVAPAPLPARRAPEVPDVVEPADVPTPVDVATASALDEDPADGGVPVAPRRVARNEPYTLEVENDESCALRLGSAGIAARCTEGTLACTQLLSGAITAPGATDTVWDCERSNQSLHFAVLSTARAVVWAENITQRDDIDGWCAMDHASAELVPAGTHPTPAVLVHTRDCQFSSNATSRDDDSLWIWRDGAMHKLAESEFTCEFSSTRMGRNFGAGMVSCQGSYVVPNTAGTGVNLVGYRVAVRQSGVGTGRLMKGTGHIQRRLLWSRMLSTELDE